MPLPTYKDIMDLISKGFTVEAQEKLMDLRETCILLKDENLQLKERVNDLEQKLSLREKLQFERGMYWVHEQGNRDGPFCTACWDSKDKLIRMKHVSGESSDHATYYCTCCQFFHHA